MWNEWKILCIGSSIHYVSHIFWRTKCKNVSHHSSWPASARHLATLLIVLVYISRPRHWDTHNLPPNSRESGAGAGAGPGVATSLLLQPYSWIRVSVGVRPPSRRGEPRPASLWWLVMARWEAEWWWWVRCSAATNFDVYAAPSSETEVSPASNSFHSL